MFSFLIDHNVPKSVGLFLLRKKYNIKLVKDVDPEMPDMQVIKLAIEENESSLVMIKIF